MGQEVRVESSCPVCREQNLVVIQLGVAEHEVVLVSCASCGTRWWRRDGVESAVGEVVALAASAAQASPRRRSGRRPRTA